MRFAIMLGAGLLFTGASFGGDSAPNYVAVDGPQVSQYWKSGGKGERIQLPKSFVRSGADGCVAVGYSVEADGKPANLVVLRAAFSDQADKQVVADLETRVIKYFAGMRYEPAPSNATPQPIYTYGSYSFAAFQVPSTKAAVNEHSDFVRSHCLIADFPTAVARGELLKKPDA